jgi:HECT-domain (ubiquitin-transferase)
MYAYKHLLFARWFTTYNRRFSISSTRTRETLYPRAHTCFNKLDLPLYETKKELEDCLSVAINFAYTGFDID